MNCTVSNSREFETTSNLVRKKKLSKDNLWSRQQFSYSSSSSILDSTSSRVCQVVLLRGTLYYFLHNFHQLFQPRCEEIINAFEFYLFIRRVKFIVHVQRYINSHKEGRIHEMRLGKYVCMEKQPTQRELPVFRLYFYIS